MGVAAYWLLGDDAQAERLYAQVDALPDSLVQSEEPLGKAVLAAFRLRRAALMKKTTSSSSSLSQTTVKMCEVTSKLLQDSLTVDSCHKPESKVLVSWYIEHADCI